MNNKLITSTSKRLVIIAAACLLGGAASQGATVRFNGATHAPGDNLQVGAVHISGSSAWGPGGQPATIAGTGLGSATIGPADSIDRQMCFSADNFPANTDVMEGLTLSVNGRIDSISFTPRFFASGISGLDSLPFQVMIYPLALAPGAVANGPMTPSWITVNPANGGSLRYTGVFAAGQYSAFSISLQSAGNPSANLYPYLQSHNFPDATFQFGVRLDSISFTPFASSVPEPSSFSLFGLGLIGLGWRRWQGKKS